MEIPQVGTNEINTNKYYDYKFLAIANPKAPPGVKDAQKSFNFDYSYWSHNVSR